MTETLNKRRFKNKIYRLMFSALIVSLLAVSTAIFLFQRNMALNSLEDELKVFSGVIGNRSIAALVFIDPKAAENNLATARYRSTIREVCLFDALGQSFAQYNSIEHKSTCPSSVKAHEEVLLIDDSGLMHLTTPIWDNQELAGYLSISSSLADVQRLLFSTLSMIGLSFLLIMSIAYVLISRLLSRTLYPLDSLYRTAIEIGNCPLSKRRAVKMTDDEIGQLVDVFNQMLDKIADENAALTQSEKRFRILAKHAPIGIYLTDKDNNLVYVNEQWEKITEQHQHISQAAYLHCVDESDREIYKSISNLSRQRQSPQVLEYRYKTPIHNQERVFMEYVSPLMHHDDDTNSSELSGYIGSLLDVSELKEAQLELEKLAFYDPLTNLPNRRFFKEHLHFSIASAERDPSRLAIIMLDMDNFKKVNDSLGHDAGDELLAMFAERMRKAMYPRDVVSRMGGDEFMILLKGVKNTADIDRIAKRILGEVLQPFSLRNNLIELSCSLGVATYPADGDTPELLVRNADLALYHAKDSGKNQVSYFSSVLEERIKERLYLERKLRHAHTNDEMQVYIQPKWDIARQRFIGGEALLRWIDPQDGFIGPDRFIPIAEEVGLIIDLGEWVITRVCRELALYKSDFAKIGIESVAINLSARQFFSSSLLDMIKRNLHHYQIPAQMIEFEITESAVMDDILSAIDIMHQIKALGCGLSIDDFGTGYSSLSYLKRFPIDTVKIDRSFISDIPHDTSDVEISSAIIAMAHKLGLKVVAEGVETIEQNQFLIEQHCDFIQGYYFARPMPIAQLFTQLPEIASSDDVTKLS